MGCALGVAVVVKKAAGAPYSGKSSKTEVWLVRRHTRTRCQQVSAQPAHGDRHLARLFLRVPRTFCFGIQYLRIPLLNNINYYAFFGPIMIIMIINMVPSHLSGLLR